LDDLRYRRQEGVPISGLVARLDAAKAAFKSSYERLTDKG
jgi:hypothetical protein